MESSKYSIVEAYNDLNNLDFKQDWAEISNYITKRLEKNKDLDDIVHMKNTRTVSPGLLAELQCCQPTSAAVEQNKARVKFEHCEYGKRSLRLNHSAKSSLDDNKGRTAWRLHRNTLVSLNDQYV